MKIFFRKDQKERQDFNVHKTLRVCLLPSLNSLHKFSVKCNKNFKKRQQKKKNKKVKGMEEGTAFYRIFSRFRMLVAKKKIERKE